VLSINGQTLRGATHTDATTALRNARSLKLAVVVVCKRADEEVKERGGYRAEEPHCAGESYEQCQTPPPTFLKLIVFCFYLLYFQCM